MATKLRDHLQRLREPVEVDAIGDVVDAAEGAVRTQVDALTRRIADAAEDMRTTRVTLLELARKAEDLDDATGRGKGVMATVRASLAPDQVAEARERAAWDLAGEATTATRVVQRGLGLAEDVDLLRDDLVFALDALRDLEARARSGGLEREAGLVARAAARLSPLDDRLATLAIPLTEPARDTAAAVNRARAQVAELRADERAATVAEALLDDVISPRGGSVAQQLRKAVAEAAPGLVADLDRDGVERGAAMAELDGALDRVTEQERRDAELRRAAQAELDALEWE